MKEELEVQVGPCGQCLLCGKDYDLCGFTKAGFEALGPEVQGRLLSELLASASATLQFPLIVCASWYEEEFNRCTPEVICPHCKKASCDHRDETCWKCGGKLPEKKHHEESQQ